MRTGCRVKKEVVALCYVDDILIRQLTHNPEEIKVPSRQLVWERR